MLNTVWIVVLTFCGGLEQEQQSGQARKLILLWALLLLPCTKSRSQQHKYRMNENNTCVQLHAVGHITRSSRQLSF